MRTQTPTKRVYLLDTNEVDNLALDGSTATHVRYLVRVLVLLNLDL